MVKIPDLRGGIEQSFCLQQYKRMSGTILYSFQFKLCSWCIRKVKIILQQYVSLTTAMFWKGKEALHIIVMLWDGLHLATRRGHMNTDLALSIDCILG